MGMTHSKKNIKQTPPVPTVVVAQKVVEKIDPILIQYPILSPKIISVNEIKNLELSTEKCFCGNPIKNFAGSYYSNECLLYFYCDDEKCIMNVTEDMSRDNYRRNIKYARLEGKENGTYRHTNQIFGTKLIYYKYYGCIGTYFGSYMYRNQGYRKFGRITDQNEMDKKRITGYVTCCFLEEPKVVLIFKELCSKMNIVCGEIQHSWPSCVICGGPNVCGKDGNGLGHDGCIYPD